MDGERLWPRIRGMGMGERGKRAEEFLKLQNILATYHGNAGTSSIFFKLTS